jgi:hypothetical protein
MDILHTFLFITYCLIILHQDYLEGKARNRTLSAPCTFCLNINIEPLSSVIHLDIEPVRHLRNV